MTTSQRQPRAWLLRYAAAAGLAAAAVVVRFAIDGFLDVDPPFLLLFPAILGAALWFGLGPALLCTALGALAVAWYWMPPEDSLAVRDAGDVQALLLFTASGVLTSLLVESRRRSRARIVELEKAPDGIFIADLQGRYTDVNAAGCQMLGYTREELLGKTILDLIPPEDAPRLARDREAFLRGEVGVDEWLLRKKDGTWLPVEVSARILPDGRWQGLVRDVTERRRRQEATEEHVARLSKIVDVRTEELREREALMQAVVETAVDAIITIDETGKVHSFNLAAERMLGYSAAEVVGRNVSLLMPAPHREAHDGYLSAYVTTGLKKIIGIGREVTARRKDGTVFPVYLSVSEVRLEGRRLFTGFIRDLTEQKKLEQEFLRAQKMEAVGNLSGGIAHDFNNLLMGILACSRIAGEELEEKSPGRELFQEIGAAANRGIALTRRLLAFSRRSPVQLHPTSIDGVVRENETMLRQLLGEDIHLRIEPSPSGASVRADDGLVEQVLVNLVVNARDAMPRGGEITVATHNSGNEVVLEVRDTGSGIPPELRARIFEPFFTTKGPDKGTGLGLSTVKRIVEQLSGRIELESEVGRGTTFRLVFPRSEPAPEREAAAARPAPAGPAGRTVLLVEDDRLVRASLRRFLEGRGYRVLVAGSPSEARAQAGANGPGSIDVLVTDMVLPETSGSELAGKLRTARPDLKVIFMSANPAEMLIEQGRLPPGAPYLEKPFEMEALDRLLGQVLS